MSGHLARLSWMAQDRVAQVTVCIVMGALTGLSHVTARKRRLFGR